MKKVLAIVLALVMVLPLTSAVFAVNDVASGRVFFGAKDNVYTNPGEKAIVELQLFGNVGETREYDRDGTLAISFMAYTQDMSLSPLDGIQLTEAGINAGAELIVEDYSDESTIYATIRVPASCLYDTNIVLAEITVNVSEEWEIVDYEATTELAVGIGEFEGVFVESENGDIETVDNVDMDSANLLYKYQPTAKEQLIELLKKKINGIIALFETAFNYLKSTFLKPAIWNKDA